MQGQSLNYSTVIKCQTYYLYLSNKNYKYEKKFIIPLRVIPVEL